VVQNRIYSKKKKIELGIFANNVSGDPFLSVYTLGGSLGYHFTEFFSTHLFAWNAFVSPSSALLTLQNDLKSTTNTNQPKFFYGAEFKGSFIYGKLSIIGEFIAYFDAYLTAGTGMIGTESGNNPALFFGLGQQIHVSKVFSLNVDYRYLVYNETIVGKVQGANLGKELGIRTNISGVVTLGISMLFDFFR
jgi:outer membrane beta-barrel protein